MFDVLIPTRWPARFQRLAVDLLLAVWVGLCVGHLAAGFWRHGF